MECNKDEAVRAKGIAEKKLTENDIAGAKKFALKAQNLFPGLDDLPQFLATLEVYVSAEKKINSEVDWYDVLGVDPLADDETLRKHYRKLALTLHPDKNKSVGADGAFKILSEAWSLLSDKAKRMAYDQKRNLRGIYQKATTGNSSTPADKNGFHTYTSNNNSSARDQKSATNPQPTPAPPRPSKPNTFWTACNRCKMQYEYLKNYLNQNLICPNCHEPFFAVEMPAPPINGHNSCPPWPSYHQQRNAKRHFANNSSAPGRKPASAPNVGTPGFSGVGSINSTRVQQGPHSKAGSDRSAPASNSSSAQAAHVVHPAHENLKRGREDAQTAAMREEAIRRKSNASKKTDAGLASNAGASSGKGDRPMKKRRIDEHKVCNNGKEMANRTAIGNGGVGQGSVSGYRKGSSGTERVRFSGSNKPNGIRELSQSELRNMLMAKAKMEIHKKLNEWSITAALKASHKESREMEKEKPKVTVNCVQKATVNGAKNDGNKNGACLDTKNQVQPKKSSPAVSSVDSDTKDAEIMMMSVPDPDFHDFDKDRTEKSFGENQVWAAYDDDDGMPRYYALIHSVLSKRPFKMRISWLNSKSNSEFGPINWVGSGFSKTSGDFRIGKYEVNNTLNSFSHRVKWIKGARGAIQIFPRKGDVWALYRNWSSDWNELTPDEVIHKYDMVKVLEDYNEEQGVTVAPLVKVAGFKSVFHQHLDPREVRTIPREEMFRFSHQVPSYLLTGQEARNAPKGCQELDPAAMPLELLHVITEVKELETVETAEKVMKEDGLEGLKNAEEELHLGENANTTKEKLMNEDAKNVDKSNGGEDKGNQVRTDDDVLLN
uniref:J domain-containing protein n=1 Tax=Davidia involucrata TaxID=16924 RepID=A0A5B7BXN5_DAVIN